MILLGNGLVAYYFWILFQHGAPVLRLLPEFVLSLIGVNLAIILGRWLGERSRRPRG
ncbi:MAG TPA: hypothetical protein VLZ50_10920 [Terracidiphilus sp.]|nr:hypothetical protein [Terracidiphilus sp.]